MKIPKYKRDKFTFLSNLKAYTASQEFPITLKRNGYLLSEYYTDDFHIDLAAWVKGRRNLLISDNGNFSRMRKIAQNFTPESVQLLHDLENHAIPKYEALEKRKSLIERIVVFCKQQLDAQNKVKIINNQLKINPDYIIALEDLTIPVMMICGLFDPVFEPDPIEVKGFQENSKKLYEQQTGGLYGSKRELANVQKFHVVHSFNFASAKQGASLLSHFNPDGVAISFGAAINSRRWISEWDLGYNDMFALPEKLPEMYLATASISMGYLEGNPDQKPIHILGIGSPILIVLLGLIFSKNRAVSIDSTAPFKDAFQSKIYGSRYGFLKMNMFKVAAHALINKEPYTSTTPFFREFERAFPHNWQKLRSELGISTSSDINIIAETLEKETVLLERYIPFFSKMRSGDDPLIKHLRIARTGHNYWIIHQICNSIRDRKDEVEKLAGWVNYQVKRYKKVANSKWAKTLEIIYSEVSKRILR